MYLKTSLATTYSEVHAIVDQIDDKEKFHRMADMKNSNTDIILNSYLNKKFSQNHTNRTGFTVTGLSYDLDFNKSEKMGLYEPMQQIAKGSGTDLAFSAFTTSVFSLNKNLDASLGLTGQFFTLNKHWSIEPRASLKWKLPNNQSLAFGYGLHSTRERLDYYYIKTPETGDRLVNKDMDFSKSHHFSLSYSKKLSDNISLFLFASLKAIIPCWLYNI